MVVVGVGVGVWCVVRKNEETEKQVLDGKLFENTTAQQDVVLVFGTSLPLFVAAAAAAVG